MATFSLSSTVASHPVLPFKKMKEEIVGKNYQLSLAFVGEKRAKTLNEQYRQKTYVPNVLSFPLDKNTGEIYICTQKAKLEAKEYDMTYKNFVGFLFIHGLLHLKGLDHGATMTKAENRYKNKYRLS